MFLYKHYFSPFNNLTSGAGALAPCMLYKHRFPHATSAAPNELSAQNFQQIHTTLLTTTPNCAILRSSAAADNFQTSEAQQVNVTDYISQVEIISLELCS